MKYRDIAYCAVMTALLIAAQYVLSFVSGVELVTVLLLTFSYVFGVRCGVLTAAAFSLLRCLIFGFFPNVLLLYLVYYTSFAALFGLCGRKGLPRFVCPLLLGITGTLSLAAAITGTGLPISAVYITRVRVFLWILFGISMALLVIYFYASKSGPGRELASLTALATFMTVLFTLLDDIITPLTMGYSAEAAAGYFYGGFIAMLPQTVCAAVSVFALFLPLKKAFEVIKRQKHGYSGDNYEN